MHASIHRREAPPPAERGAGGRSGGRVLLPQTSRSVQAPRCMSRPTSRLAGPPHLGREGRHPHGPSRPARLPRLGGLFGPSALTGAVETSASCSTPPRMQSSEVPRGRAPPPFAPALHVRQTSSLSPSPNRSFARSLRSTPTLRSSAGTRRSLLTSSTRRCWTTGRRLPYRPRRAASPALSRRAPSPMTLRRHLSWRLPASRHRRVTPDRRRDTASCARRAEPRQPATCGRRSATRPFESAGCASE